MESGGASRTAVFVCQGRAVADGRLAVGRFSDPVAGRLLRPEELEPVRAARQEGSAAGGRERLAVESVRACAEVVVPRTVVIDEAVTGALRDADGAQVVLLGAGLDGRAWRLEAFSGTTVFSVDHPASQAETRDRAAALTPLARRLVFVPVDLTVERLDAALEAAGHDRSAPTVWVWEGVVPYLARPDVVATVEALVDRSAPGSVVVVNYQTPSLVAALGRRVAGLAARVAGTESITADEPWRSAWSPGDLAGLLAGRGLAVTQDVSLLDVARRLGSPASHSRSLANGRVAVARLGGVAGTGAGG